MIDSRLSDTQRAIAGINSGLFVLTAQFEGKRAGVMVRSVQPCADEPLLLCAAVRRGHWIEPIIRDSHAFAICKINQSDKLLVRKFAETARPRDGDPFDCMPTLKLVTGAPIITRAPIALDCEVIRHFDLEADHELYIGLVVGAHLGSASIQESAETQPPLFDLHTPRSMTARLSTEATKP
jgi:flavin reductase (DIM6/NTAB) family NADH-FMN oxidoreductase RutF